MRAVSVKDFNVKSLSNKHFLHQASAFHSFLKYWAPSIPNTNDIRSNFHTNHNIFHLIKLDHEEKSFLFCMLLNLIIISKQVLGTEELQVDQK